MEKAWLDQQLKDKKFILITGKGGIGKTLLSAALAMRARQAGLRVLLVEQSSIDQLGPLLGVAGVGHDEKWHDNLGVANFTAAGNFRDFITKHLMKSNLLDVLVKNKLVHSFFTAIPGFAELILLGRLYYAVNLASVKPDLVIFDSYSSGHFLSLMTTPDAVLSSGLAGPIAQQTQVVKNWLSDGEQCVTFYVAMPEDLVLSEASDFLPILHRRSPVKIGCLILNRSLVNALPGEIKGIDSASNFLRQKLERQKYALSSFYKRVSGDNFLKSLPVLEVPELGSIDEPLSMATVESLLMRSFHNG